MKIEKFFNKKENKDQYRARFQLNKREFFPSADTKKELLALIDEIRTQERRSLHNLSTVKAYPAFSALAARHQKHIRKRNHAQMFSRVCENLLLLLPDGIRLDELKPAHFQRYIDKRRTEISRASKKVVLDETIDKELFSVSKALKNAPLYFDEIGEDYTPPKIPRLGKGKKRKRSRIVSRYDELARILDDLRQPREGKQTDFHAMMRRRLADDLEFRFETGLRRKEVARLKKSQYDAAARSLRSVIRWKTDTVTPFFPLTKRAAEIVEERIRDFESNYIFTLDGETVESEFRTLKQVCGKLKILYGKFTEGGFVAHDLRRSFANELIEHTDIETARELLGHGDAKTTAIYLQTNEARMTKAVRRIDGEERRALVSELYEAAAGGRIGFEDFYRKLNEIYRLK